MNYNFVKVAAAVPAVKVGNCKFNTEQIESQIIQANNQGVEIIVFPELSITAYTCGDLFFQQMLMDEAEMSLIGLLNFTRSMNIISIVGMPVHMRNGIANCAAVIQKGKILGLVPKILLPNYAEFNEKRWFVGANAIGESSVLICGQQVQVSANQLFHTPSCTFGIEICEDLWAPIPPSSTLALQGADIIFNLSASSSSTGKYDYIRQMVANQSARLFAGYVYVSSGFGESSTDLVFNGKVFIYENGKSLVTKQQEGIDEMLEVTDIDVEYLRAERFRNTTFHSCAALLPKTEIHHVETAGLINNEEMELTRTVAPYPFIPQNDEQREKRCNEIFDIQCKGLAKRVVHTNCETLVVGISGGLDSTLALLVCVRTFDLLGKSRRGIVGITMPGFGTTDRTYTNAIRLMQQLGITIREISIKEACLQHFSDIGHNPDIHDTTYENSQARERTQILMDAANQMNGLVVGTGDLSELALGWATYNGDHMSMYGVNASIPKTLVKYLVEWVAMSIDDKATRDTLLDIVNTPISPELIPADENGNIKQKTEDLVGPYELHDFFLYHMLRSGYHPRKIYALACKAFKDKYDEETIKKWLTTFYRRFFTQQFKRSCMPDGPKVGSIALSPRGDWRMPSDACADAWLEECKSL